MDPQNRPMAGSRVIVLIADEKDTHTAKEVVSTETNERGAFQFRKLKPGKYQVLVQQVGFNEMLYGNVTLTGRAHNRGWLRIVMEIAT